MLLGFKWLIFQKLETQNREINFSALLDANFLVGGSAFFVAFALILQGAI
jgi:hypothetical protein